MPRPIEDRVEDHLIVALDLPTVAAARAMAERLDGVVSFFKLGLWLIFAPGFDRLLEDLVAQGKKVFLDAKMFDIGETVKQGVARAAERGANFVTVHGDRDIIRAAVDGRRGTALRILAITALTSIDDDGARDLGHIPARCRADLPARRNLRRTRPGALTGLSPARTMSATSSPCAGCSRHCWS